MKLLKKQSGFTVMELMVVVVIIGLLSTLVIADYNSIGKKSAVASAAQNLASDIRKAQSFALNGNTIDGNSKGRWGIYFSEASTSYVLFADKDQNNARGSGEDYLTTNLPKDVKISAVDPGVESFVVYTPPNPTIVISSSTISSSTITLSNLDGSNSRQIEFNVFGLVDVQ